MWLAGFCLARAAFSMVLVTYSASLVLLKDDWSMTAGQSGLISSAHHIGFLTSLFTVGFLSDRFGAKRTYLISSLAACLSALLFAGFARDFVSGFLLYGLVGLCSGGSYTPGLNLIAQRFPSVRRGRAIGFYIAASSAGYAFSLLLSSLMIPLGGWKLAFWVTAMGPLLGMLLGAWMLRGVANLVPLHPPDAGEAGVLGAVVRNKPAMLMVGAYAFHSWELLGLWAWIPYYLAMAYGGGMDATMAASMGASFSALTYFVSVGGPITGGSLSDRLGRSTVIILFSSISTIMAFSIGWLVVAPFWLAVLAGVLMQFFAVGDSPVISTAQTELVSPRYLGAAYSLRSVAGFGLGAVSPWVFGEVLDWGRVAYSPTVAWGLAFSMLGAGAVFTPLCMWWLRRLPESRRMAGGKR